MEYVAVDQSDLDIYFDFLENLAGYTAEICYYLESAGTSATTSVTATVSTQTTALTYVHYSVTVANPIFDEEGEYVVWPEVTSASNRWRAVEPVYIEVRTKGKPR
jgi:hypothetical protein